MLVSVCLRLPVSVSKLFLVDLAQSAVESILVVLCCGPIDFGFVSVS